MHILFIVNPISGLGLGKELPEKIRRIPEYDSIPYDIVLPSMQDMPVNWSKMPGKRENILIL